MERRLGLWEWWLRGVAVSSLGGPLGLFLGCRPFSAMRTPCAQ